MEEQITQIVVMMENIIIIETMLAEQDASLMYRVTASYHCAVLRQRVIWRVENVTRSLGLVLFHLMLSTKKP